MRLNKTVGKGSNMISDLPRHIRYPLLLLTLLTMIMVAANAKADFADDYDVDWPPSNERGVHVLRIVISDCKTLFKIKDEDFYDVTLNEEALMKALRKAIARAHSGCKTNPETR